MIHKRTSQFIRMQERLPDNVKRMASEKFELFKSNSSHPSLRFKRMEISPDHWEVSVSMDYRAVCTRDGETFTWIFIGKHREFDKRFRRRGRRG